MEELKAEAEAEGCLGSLWAEAVAAAEAEMEELQAEAEAEGCLGSL